MDSAGSGIEVSQPVSIFKIDTDEMLTGKMFDRGHWDTHFLRPSICESTDWKGGVRECFRHSDRALFLWIERMRAICVALFAAFSTQWGEPIRGGVHPLPSSLKVEFLNL